MLDPKEENFFLNIDKKKFLSEMQKIKSLPWKKYDNILVKSLYFIALVTALPECNVELDAKK